MQNAEFRMRMLYLSERSGLTWQHHGQFAFCILHFALRDSLS